MTVFALIGAKALFLVYGWLLSAIIGSYLSERKGYGEKPGLASGLLLPAINVVVWIFFPARPGSKWKEAGIFGSQTKADRAAEEDEAEGTGAPDGPEAEVKSREDASGR